MKEAEIFSDDPKSAESIKQLEQVVHHLFVNACLFITCSGYMKYVNSDALSRIFICSVCWGGHFS